MIGCPVGAESRAGAFASDLPPDEIIFGKSSAMREVRQKIEKLAGIDLPVLILGESGTGKEVLAKLLHQTSPWRDGPFVKVPCPAIPPALMESELFGYEKGSFTGAYGQKIGRVEMANRGTLFLDEIAELDPGLQAKLLQLLQDGQFCRIGAQEDRRIEARVICATNRDLFQDMKSGSFRTDLFYRINVVNLRVPPLRQRAEDIPDLINYFLGLFNARFEANVNQPSAQTIRILRRYEWPGNIRQLENMMKRYVVLGLEEAITADLAMARPDAAEPFMPTVPRDVSQPLRVLTQRAVEEVEKKIIMNALAAYGWNRKKTARVLKISYRSLLNKIRQADLPPAHLNQLPN